MLIYYGLISYINEWFAVNQPNYYKMEKPLKDFGFILLPQINPDYGNYMIYLMLFYFCVRFLLKDISIITSFFLIIAIIFTMRLVCFNVTHMPFTWKNCENTKSWQRKYMFIYDSSSCGDYMFSGHTANYILILLFFIYFSQNMKEKILVAIYSFFGIVAVIAGRIHYSVDVFVAIFITILSFYTFRYFCLTHKYFKILELCAVHK